MLRPSSKSMSSRIAVSSPRNVIRNSSPNLSVQKEQAYSNKKIAFSNVIEESKGQSLMEKNSASSSQINHGGALVRSPHDNKSRLESTERFSGQKSNQDMRFRRSIDQRTMNRVSFPAQHGLFKTNNEAGYDKLVEKHTDKLLDFYQLLRDVTVQNLDSNMTKSIPWISYNKEGLKGKPVDEVMTMLGKIFCGIIKYLSDFFVNNSHEKERISKNFDFNDSQNLNNALEKKGPNLRTKVLLKSKQAEECSTPGSERKNFGGKTNNYITMNNFESEVKKIDIKYKIMLDIARENVSYSQNQVDTDRKKYHNYIASLDKEILDLRHTVSEKDKQIDAANNQILKFFNQSSKRDEFYSSLNNYTRIQSSRKPDVNYKSQEFVIQNTPKQKNVLPDKQYFYDDIQNVKNQSKEEFDFYKKIIGDSKLDHVNMQEKSNKINSLQNQKRSKDMQIKKDEMSLCKLQINIDDKNSALDSLKKQNGSLYNELKKIRDREELLEKDLWRNESCSEQNPKTIAYYKKKKLQMQNENGELKKRVKLLTTQQKTIDVKEKAFEIERASYFYKQLNTENELVLEKQKHEEHLDQKNKFMLKNMSSMRYASSVTIKNDETQPGK